MHQDTSMTTATLLHYMIISMFPLQGHMITPCSRAYRNHCTDNPWETFNCVSESEHSPTQILGCWAISGLGILMRFGDSKQKTQIESIFLAEECGNASMEFSKSCRMKKAVSNYCLFKENILNLRCYRTNLKCYRNEVDRQHFASMCFQRLKECFVCFCWFLEVIQKG